MGYSYCSSELNLRIHIPKSQFHFPYSVTLGTKGLVISHLCTRVPFETATSSTRGRPLYPTFVVYLRTIHGPLSFISYTQAADFLPFTRWIILSPTLRVSWTDNLIFQRTFRTFPICFTKLRILFEFSKFFLIFFSFFIRTFPNMFYKVKTFVLICQVLCELFLVLFYIDSICPVEICSCFSKRRIWCSIFLTIIVVIAKSIVNQYLCFITHMWSFKG